MKIIIGDKISMFSNNGKEITSFRSFIADLPQELGSHPDDLWIALDMDFTLSQTDSPFSYEPYITLFKKEYDSLIQGLSAKEQIELTYAAMYRARQQLVEDETTAIVRRLQAQRTVFVLTNSLTGRVGRGALVEMWREKELQRLGLDFSQAFERFPNQSLAEGVVFYQGILCANKKGKAIALDFFTGIIKRQPKILFFVDDQQKNIDDLAKWCHERKISYHGYLYTAAKPILAPEISKDRFMAFWRNAISDVRSS